MAAVQYVTLYLADGTPVQVIYGTVLYQVYLNSGATLYPSQTPPGSGIPTDPNDPFTQYITEQELGDALAGAVTSVNDQTGHVTLGASDVGAQPAGSYISPSDLATGLDGKVDTDDPRLTDARTPTTHSHTAGQISDASSIGRTVLTAADGPAIRSAIGAGTSSLTLGTTGTTAAAGNDGRLSNARTPTAHTHPVTDLQTTGTASSATFLRGDGTWNATPDPIQGLQANAIYNGEMHVFQSGISINPLVHLSRVADRWIYGQSGAGAVMRCDMDADVPDRSVQNSLAFTTVTASAVAADQEKHVRYAIEGSDLQPFVGQVATLSFWVKVAAAGTYCVAFTNSGRDRTYVANYTVNAAATWEYKTITVDFNAVPAGGTWDYGSGQGIGIRFAMAVGANYQGTAGVWNSANVVGSAAQTDVGSVAGRYLKLSKVQLNLGAVARPFYHRPLIDTYRLCTRYLYVVTDSGFRRSPVSSVSTAAITEMYLPLPSRMRAVPKVSLVGTRGTDWMLRTAADADNTSGTLLATPAYGRDFGLVRFEGGTFTAGASYHLLLGSSAGRIVFDAEL